MKTLYKLLLAAGYTLKNKFGEKSFSFEKVNGDWSKIIYVSKYGKEYKISIIEGVSTFIKTKEASVKTYKEVLTYI